MIGNNTCETNVKSDSEPTKDDIDVHFIELKVSHLHSIYKKYVFISRFNNYKPPTMTLFQHIQLAWAKKCEISFCSKDYFIVKFYDHVDYETSV